MAKGRSLDTYYYDSTKRVETRLTEPAVQTLTVLKKMTKKSACTIVSDGIKEVFKQEIRDYLIEKNCLFTPPDLWLRPFKENDIVKFEVFIFTDYGLSDRYSFVFNISELLNYRIKSKKLVVKLQSKFRIEGNIMYRTDESISQSLNFDTMENNLTRYTPNIRENLADILDKLADQDKIDASMVVTPDTLSADRIDSILT